MIVINIKMSKYAIIFGTRPEYLKVKSIIEEFKLKNMDIYKVLYISQHEHIDEELDESYEKIHIENSSNYRLNNIGIEILKKLPMYIYDCSYVIVQGDTATAFYSALTGFQLGKKIIHIEAGLRTYDITKPFPEESYRQMISRIASIHFTPHNDCIQLLKNERVFGKIINSGNTILDLIVSYNLEVTMNKNVLITFHRRENWNKIDELLIGLKKLIKITTDCKYIWYLHHNPELQQTVKSALYDINVIELKEPCKHSEMAKQIASSNFIITDSGGIQEEASFLGKHCIVLRTSTERTHIPNEYITILKDYTQLDTVFSSLPNKILPPCNIYGYGNSAAIIVDSLLS